ncbi:lipid II:glycine glycyltransferase FemX [Patescibacteria group bacterium]
MILTEIKSKDHWEDKICSQKRACFLQSWHWGEFQRSLGRKVWHLDLDGEYFLVIKMDLPFNKNYLYLPRVNNKLDKKQISTLIQLAKTEKSIFIRVEPVKQNLVEFGFKAVASVQPKKTLLLDLQKSEEDLLLEMHQKTRYNIRLATKKGVNIVEGTQDDLTVFYELIADTYKRKKINIYNQDYYKKLIINFSKAKIYLAKFQEKTLTANLILFYGDTVTYLHGGSSQEHKNLMAPHLLQWEVIKIAKEQGYKFYDFWGIDEIKWPGVTRFKKGFGGIEAEYQGAFDLVTDNLWYLSYQIVKKFR